MINSLDMKIKKKALVELEMFSLEKRRMSRDILFLTVINRMKAILFHHSKEEQVNIGRSKGFDFNIISFSF